MKIFSYSSTSVTILLAEFDKFWNSTTNIFDLEENLKVIYLVFDNSKLKFRFLNLILICISKKRELKSLWNISEELM